MLNQNSYTYNISFVFKIAENSMLSRGVPA